jgi:flagellar hook protein FlgE
LGNAHNLSLYFALQPTVTEGDPKTWTVHTLIDGVTVGSTPAGTLQFDSEGRLPEGMPLPINITAWTPLSPQGGANGAGSQDFQIALANSTQYAREFSVNSLSQDGCTAGQLNRIGIDESGVITGFYSNSQSRALGQVVLYNFANPQGLKQLGDSAWGATPTSGEALIGAPGTGSLGGIQSGALEGSNVDVSGELVNLILAQRNYQANAQTIQAADKVTQTILNIR